MKDDSINDPSNELNKNIYESLQGFYRITFDPFIYVIIKYVLIYLIGFVYLCSNFSSSTSRMNGIIFTIIKKYCANWGKSGGSK